MSHNLFMHEKNLLGKISSDYNKVGKAIKKFYDTKYFPVKETLLSLKFLESDFKNFKKATKIFNEYYNELREFSSSHGIKSQSKFESTFLEEISIYLFNDLDEIKNNEYNFYNKGIFSGLKLDSNKNIDIVKKDVDFCIGKKIKISVDDEQSLDIILPIICVEVKTYLDATMLGEIKSSSRSLKNASPNTQLYTLIGYRSIADEHIIAAKQEALINEIFCLRKSEYDDIDYMTIYNYWYEIKKAIKIATSEFSIESPGRLFYPEQSIKQ